MSTRARSLPAVPTRTDPDAAEREVAKTRAARAIPAEAPPALGWERTTWLSAASQVLALMAFGLSLPFLPLYVQVLGVHDRAGVAVWSGVLAGAAAIPMALMAPVWGALADRYGRKAMLVRSMLGGAALIAAMGFVGDVWQLLVLRVVQGGLTGSQSAASALVAVAAPSRHLGFALGLVNTAVQVGNSIGPAFGGLVVGGLGFRGSFILGGILLAMGGLMVLLWVDEPRDARRMVATRRTRDLASDGSGLVRMLRPFTWPRFRTVLLLQVGTQFAFSASIALVPLYLQEMRRPDWLSAEVASGLAVTLTAVAAAMVMPFLGRWIDNHAPKYLLIASLVGVALVLVPQALVPNVALFLALRVAMGLCTAGLTVALGVLTKIAAPIGREGAAYGAAGSAQALGWGLGPMLGSALAAIAGIPALFLFCALVVGSLVVPAAHSRR